MYTEEQKEKLLDKAVEEFQRPNKDFAKVRDANAILVIILMYAAAIHVILGAFSYIEITIFRFNEVLTFCIIWTIALMVYMVPFAIAKIVIYYSIGEGSNYNPPLKQYDRKIIRNKQDQFTINWILWWPSIIIIIVRWTYYGRIGNDDSFSSIFGLFYGIMALTCLAMHFISILHIVRTLLSYYYRYIYVEQRKQTQYPYKEQAPFGIVRDGGAEEKYNILYK